VGGYRRVEEPLSDGWTESAQAWLASIGDDGDYGRKFVLDAPMLARVKRQDFKTALDVGCGEGRFCRMLQTAGISTVGIDPTAALVERARQLDPTGDYRIARAETLDVPSASFDLVVSYLSLIDIADLALAASKMSGALRPGGMLLIANLTSFNTAGMPEGWNTDSDGQRRFCIDHYLEARPVWVSWHGIRVQNWYRPLSAYMTAFLECGLELRHFDEPAPVWWRPRGRRALSKSAVLRDHGVAKTERHLTARSLAAKCRSHEARRKTC
jgi:SAM-dependent methyltransferase